jgi:hypothetical protein
VRRHLPLLVLALSVAVHLGVMATYVHEQVRRRRIDEQCLRTIYVSRTAMKQADENIRLYQAERRAANAAYDSALADLGRLGDRPDPDTTEVDATLDRLEQSAAAIEWAGLRFGLRSDSLYRPEFSERWRRSNVAYLDSVLKSVDARKAREQR